MGTHPHLARERQRGMPAQPDQRLMRQVRDRASAPALAAPSPRRPGTHPAGRDPDAR
jgi:hypothetical protein